MEIKIRVPLLTDISSKGVLIHISPKGTSWLKAQLGKYENKSGVYIHRSENIILYVGNTTKGKWGNFGERLRREFQETSSQNSNLYQVLKSYHPKIHTVLFDLDEIDIMIDHGTINLSKERKALILEQVLIGIFDPIGNKK